MKAVAGLTGSRTRPQSCLRGVEGASRRSRSTACLAGSFWLGYSRVPTLGQDGNASVSSGKIDAELIYTFTQNT